VTVHELPLERRTLHGHFSPDLEPILTVEPGDTIAFAALDGGWGLEAPRTDDSPRRHFEPRDPKLDEGHALVGPVEVRGARAGQTLEVRIDSVLAGSYGFTVAGGWSTPLNDRLKVGSGDDCVLVWELDAAAGIGRDREGREVKLSPFLGVLGMPPPEPGNHRTGPPRVWGGNLDCKELVAGTTLFLPIPVNGALFSAGDGHALQGDGEVSQTAIECPIERAELTLELREDLELSTPLALTGEGWLALGLGDDLNEAAENATDAILDVMGHELGFARRDALALASLVVDLRVTQMVNGVVGVHAVLPHGAIGLRRI
jgi:acetamidase/formamidase